MVAWELVLVFFYFWLLHFVLGPSYPHFLLNALQLPGPFSCGGYYILQLLRIVPLVITLSTGGDIG